MSENEGHHFRGLHLVVINPENAKITFARVFDTYKSSKAFEALIVEVLAYVPKDYLIIAAC